MGCPARWVISAEQLFLEAVRGAAQPLFDVGCAHTLSKGPPRLGRQPCLAFRPTIRQHGAARANKLLCEFRAGKHVSLFSLCSVRPAPTLHRARRRAFAAFAVSASPPRSPQGPLPSLPLYQRMHHQPPNPTTDDDAQRAQRRSLLKVPHREGRATPCPPLA